MSKNGKWTFSENEEFFNYGEYFDTKKEAIAAGKKYFADDDYALYVGQVAECGLGVMVDVESIFEYINRNMCDEAGEAADDYLTYTAPEHDQELENELEDVITKWITRHGYEPTFFKVVNIESVE
ncbi:hypothetical protein [Paenibacillus polymyxa]|uniref:hypothetical protein n=1 Tax=Paenibacillus polymyxa TaxID=1406 RepID=UPI001C9E1BCA|nr:hypothetical protein [Paenibacillus polymyxa]MBY7740117.1 hypothetical protein [Paenibacillus polymyxa]